MRNITLCVALCSFLTSCAPTVGSRDTSESPFDDQVLTGADIASEFAPDGEYLVSPPLVFDGEVDRVSVLVELEEASELPFLEARSLTGDTWRPVYPSTAHGVHHVGVTELDRFDTGVELRVPVAAARSIRLLQWQASYAEHTDSWLDEALADGPTVEGEEVAGLPESLAELDVVSRSDDGWNGKDWEPRRCDRQRPKDRIALYHTVSPAASGSDAKAWVRSLQGYHLQRKFCDLGYHFVVGVDGTIYEGRPLDLALGRANSTKIGIGLLGCFNDSATCRNFRPTTPPREMIEATAHLLARLAKLDAIDIESREGFFTTLDMRGVPEIRARALEILADLPVVPEGDRPPADGEEDDEIVLRDEDGDDRDPPPVVEDQDPPAGDHEDSPTPTPLAEDGERCPFEDGCDAAFDPCETASCWTRPQMVMNACGSWRDGQSSNFSSGRFAIHRWSSELRAGTNVIKLEVVDGDRYRPAMFITDREGALLWAGGAESLSDDFTASDTNSGRDGQSATVTLKGQSNQRVHVFVTDWGLAENGFSGEVSRLVDYRLITEHTQGENVFSGVYAGIDQCGAPIPRSGLTNGTLRRTLGRSVEPRGEIVTDDESRQWVRGKVSHFGGPGDRSDGARTAFGHSAPNLRGYYIAMRFDYGPRGYQFWKNSARILLKNPNNGRMVVVRPVDWGPGISTGRIVDTSPAALRALGLVTDNQVDVAFAKPGTEPGPVD